jgi:hypothetical protein
VAQSLESGLNSLRNEGDLQPEVNRTLLDDLQQGFGIIRSRTEALARFMPRIRGWRDCPHRSSRR